ncbi:hypothetical protein QFC24_005800 [Naganishia onofrii]|uniref:Uncharacterized protein n=1 Tax=Naganishia onofrii TaxID=1851511 RepID=A0ACC2X7E1_9TREE|nr:hypothetical protein QFC24_005800 [Naganishia onofrii]
MDTAERNAGEPSVPPSLTTTGTTRTTQTPSPMEIDPPSAQPHGIDQAQPQTSHEQNEQLQASVEDTPEPFVSTSAHQRMDEPLLEETSVPAPASGRDSVAESEVRSGASVVGTKGQAGRSSVAGSEETRLATPGDVDTTMVSQAPAQTSSILSSSPTPALQSLETHSTLSSAALAPALPSALPITTTTETTAIPPTYNSLESESASTPGNAEEAQHLPNTNTNENGNENGNGNRNGNETTQEKDLPSIPIENARQPYSSSSGASSSTAGRVPRGGQGQGQGQGMGMSAGGGPGGAAGAAARGMPMCAFFFLTLLCDTNSHCWPITDFALRSIRLSSIVRCTLSTDLFLG